jgi:ABC-type nitrate/sulfonate/bicarbonate transport system substrate-binding protein
MDRSGEKRQRQGRLTMPHAALAAICALVFGLAQAQEPAKLRVKVFPGAQNLPLFAGLGKGFFAKHGVGVQLLFTANSTELRDGLANGDIEIAHSAVDNAVAMVELAGKDAVIVMGGDSSMNELFVQGYVATLADLRGRIVVVDAPNTAYALQLKKILLNAGLKAGDYVVKPVGGGAQRTKAMIESRDNAATILYPPFSFAVQKAGLKSLGRAIDLLGPYQGTGAFVMRPWARANAQTLEKYLAGYIEATRWVRDPANREECIGMLAERFHLEADAAMRTYASLMDPGFGLFPDARINPEGLRNVLALRAEIEGQWGGKPPAPDKYLEPGYYERALKMAGK